jgi:carbonic anhydrase
MCQHCPPSPEVPRRHFLKLAAGAALGFSLAGKAVAATAVPRPQNVISPDAALARLFKGNERYVSDAMKSHDFVAERPALVLGQNPFAGILSCADSRVAPEYAFDTGRGDLFVCRVAGNFANYDTIASFEYGVAVLNVPLILVLGHDACGAIDSTIKAVKDGAKFPGHIPSLIKALKPAVNDVLDQTGDLLANATAQNVRLTVKKLSSSTPILQEAIEAGKLKIVGGVYNLQDGRVNLVS